MEPGVYIVHGQVVIDGLVEVGSGPVISPLVTIGLRGEWGGPTIGPRRERRHRRQGARQREGGGRGPDRGERGRHRGRSRRNHGSGDPRSARGWPTLLASSPRGCLCAADGLNGRRDLRRDGAAESRERRPARSRARPPRPQAAPSGGSRDDGRGSGVRPAALPRARFGSTAGAQRQGPARIRPGRLGRRAASRGHPA